MAMTTNHRPGTAVSDLPPSRHHGIYILDPSKRCEPNAYLFTKTINFFLLNGYRITNDIHACSTILVNSCCVTEDKIASSMGALDLARPYAGQKQVILLGCLATLPTPRLNREQLICIGPKELDKLDDLFPHMTAINDIPAHQLHHELYEPGQGLGRGDYFILIAQGCNNSCSYCNVKRSKGSVASEPVASILSRVRQGLDLGLREFTLIADDCGSYGRDIGSELVVLLREIFALAPDFTVKLLYLYPEYLLQRFEEMAQLIGSGRISYVHLPVQSGSQRLLGLMNRNYAIEKVIENIRIIRSTGVRTTFCTHILVNFPTETLADFFASLELVKEFDEVIMLHYSDNLETAAATIYPKVTPQEAEERLEIAAQYVNRHPNGHGFVIKNFDCTLPYGLQTLPNEG